MNQQETISNPSNTEKSRQTTIIRGICEVLSLMAMPTIKNLDDELRKFGYTVTELPSAKEQITTNKQLL